MVSACDISCRPFAVRSFFPVTIGRRYPFNMMLVHLLTTEVLSVHICLIFYQLGKVVMWSLLCISWLQYIPINETSVHLDLRNWFTHYHLLITLFLNESKKKTKKH